MYTSLKSHQNFRFCLLQSEQTRATVRVMDTIVLTMEEAEQTLAELVRGMRRNRNAVVVKDAEGPLAYLTLAWRVEDCKGDEGASELADPSTEFQQPHVGPRVSYNQNTGLPVVHARPGQRMVTSEEIYEELRRDFP